MKKNAAHNKRVREQVLIRANGQCERCGQGCEALHVHHIRLRSQQREPDNPFLLAALCLPCHTWCHSQPKFARDEGLILRSYDADDDSAFYRRMRDADAELKY